MHFPLDSAPLDLVPLKVQLDIHPWRDPLLISIRDFQRPEALITPQPAPAPAAASIKFTSNAYCRVATSLQSPSSAAESVEQVTFDQAVGLTLKALARSVAVCCQCIDQHMPHSHKHSSSSNHHSAPAAHDYLLETQPHTSTAPTDRGSKQAHNQHRGQLAQYSEPTKAEHGAEHVSSQPAQSNHTADHHPQDEAQRDASPGQTPGHIATAPQQRHTEVHPSQQPIQPAPVLILFSGGVDSTLIAALAHQSLPAEVPIDLASVCFNRGSSADRLAAQDALKELAQFAPTRDWRLIQVDSTLEEVDEHRDWLLGMLPSFPYLFAHHFSGIKR